MNIRTKMILVLIPLLGIVLLITGFTSAAFTQIGLVKQAVNSFTFKSNQLESYINDQWNLLEENGLSEQETYLLAFIDSLRSYATSIIRSPSESIFVINTETSEEVLNTAVEQPISKQEVSSLLSQIELRNKDENIIDNARGWLENSFKVHNRKEVGYFFTFDKKNWIVFITNTEKAFYQPVRSIVIITIILFILAMLIGTIILLIFTSSLVNPIKNILNSMQNIIRTHTLDEHVEIEFQDEIGKLGQTFNVMIEELNHANKQIKQYAFTSVLAKKSENKIRNIFQKYVPTSVINELFQDPSRMLTGENKNLAIMFTDIRGFTTISETYAPDELVTVLNQYFEKLVDIITDNNGIIDKYIGDAIMAFFGAPLTLENSALAAVEAANIMQGTLDEFNHELSAKNRPQFKTGIGINYGLVTVGNIGSDKKMDYTVIGDHVNLGSRLEGLTKQYQQPLIFSSSVQSCVMDTIPCRAVDIVQVKGKTVGEPIFTSIPHHDDSTLGAFALHNETFKLYLEKQFKKAKKGFQEVKKMLQDDFLADMYIDRCEQYIATPPDENWSGIFILHTK